MAGEYLFTDEMGIRHSLFHEPDGRTLRLIASQATDPITDRNRAMATTNDGYTPSREMRRVASIPALIRMKWLAEEGWDAWRPDLYAAKLMQKLNDPTWHHLRTAPGHLGVSNGVMR